MESDSIRKLLKERTLDRDRIEFATGDVLDVKAGFVLAVLTFLAGQAIDLFKDVHGPFQVALMAISLGAVTVGAVLALVQWFPAKYRVLSEPAKYRPWLKDLLKRHSERKVPESETLAYLEDVEISQATERIDKNAALNKRKLRWMKSCFACVFISLFANLLTLASRHLFPLCHWAAVGGR